MSSMADQLKEILRTVEDLATSRGNRLVALTLAIPSHLVEEAVERALARTFSENGLTEVDVTLQPAKGPLRVLAAEFEA